MVIERRSLPPGVPEEESVPVAPETQAFLEAVAKSPKDPETLGKKRIKRLVTTVYNAFRKKKKGPSSVKEFVDSMQVKILTALGDPFVKNPPEDNLAKKGLSVLRRCALMMRDKKLEKRK
ncbi:MAG: hypothetical protein AAB662_00030 [Patescibacteria group bacterium]